MGAQEARRTADAVAEVDSVVDAVAPLAPELPDPRPAGTAADSALDVPDQRTRPRPDARLEYRDPTTKMVAPGARAWDLDDVLDALFFAVAAAATCWFAVLLVAGGLHRDWGTGLRLLLFWAVLAYLALPRLHRSSPGSTSPTTSSAAPTPATGSSATPSTSSPGGARRPSTPP
ncbi:hypothetical protein [Actinomyces radicidentis]|uniref:hypothetical protein n=1 Tax=Actinomyces radicidentis TaxID=111015 RepID=UPI000AD73898